VRGSRDVEMALPLVSAWMAVSIRAAQALTSADAVKSGV
jgi:hypothetical protein